MVDKKNQNIYQKIIKDRQVIMTTCMTSSLEVLKKEFGFTQEQLNKFAEKFVPTLKKNMQGGK